MSRETDDILETLEKHWPEGSKTIRSHIALLEKACEETHEWLTGWVNPDIVQNAHLESRLVKIIIALRAAGYLQEPAP